MKIHPSLMFSGGCGDAFRRYASLLGGDIVYLMTYADSPQAADVPGDWLGKVWFARLHAGGLDLTGGDVRLPLQATPWSPRHGGVRDPFGIRWEINCEPAAMPET